MEIRKYSVSGRRKTQTEIKESILAKYKVKCKCGHVVILGKDKVICSHCGNWIYRDKRTEFKEKLENARKNIR